MFSEFQNISHESWSIIPDWNINFHITLLPGHFSVAVVDAKHLFCSANGYNSGMVRAESKCCIIVVIIYKQYNYKIVEINNRKKLWKWWNILVEKIMVWDHQLILFRQYIYGLG